MRLFVALDLPWRLRGQLSTLAHGLSCTNWLPPENYHLTLRFIGEVSRHTAEEIDLALATLRAPGFPLELAGIGTHEKAGRVTALWAAVAPNPALNHLRSKIETALQRTGLPPERRRFTPHVTLARLTEPGAEPALGAWIQSHNLFRSAPVQITHFTLFSSQLGPDVAAYTAEMEYDLA